MFWAEGVAAGHWHLYQCSSQHPWSAMLSALLPLHPRASPCCPPTAGSQPLKYPVILHGQRSPPEGAGSYGVGSLEHKSLGGGRGCSLAAGLRGCGPATDSAVLLQALTDARAGPGSLGWDKFSTCFRRPLTC